MSNKIVYVGLDVDDTQYHGSALNKESGELFSFRCRPTLKGLCMANHQNIYINHYVIEIMLALSARQSTISIGYWPALTSINAM